MGKTKEITQPTATDEQKLLEVTKDKKEIVMVRGKKFNVGSLRKGTMEFVADIIANEKEESRIPVKCAAAMSLNGYFKLKLLYWLVWRWYVYVRSYRDDEVQELIVAYSKKVKEMWASYFVSTTSLTESRMTMMQMTKEEVEHFRAELITVQRGRQERSSQSSPEPEGSSAG